MLRSGAPQLRDHTAADSVAKSKLDVASRNAEQGVTCILLCDEGAPRFALAPPVAS